MNRWKLLVKVLITSTLAISLSACSTFSQNKEKETKDVDVTVSAEQLLKQGRSQSASGNYEAAIKSLALTMRFTCAA